MRKVGGPSLLCCARPSPNISADIAPALSTEQGIVALLCRGGKREPPLKEGAEGDLG